MFNRQKFSADYLQKFSQDYEKSLNGFLPDEQIHITDALLAILKCYRKKPIDYDKIQDINEELFKKYRKRLVKYSNLSPSEYFSVKSQKHLDLQFDLKVENEGGDENFFTKQERQDFLNRAEAILKNRKKFLYLMTEPREEGEELKGLKKTKGRWSRSRGDNKLVLNQAQTVLLIHYLQWENIIFKEESLDNTLAGEVFSILTGYSAQKIRTSLGENELALIRNPKNLSELHNAIVKLEILIRKEIRAVNKSQEGS